MACSTPSVTIWGTTQITSTVRQMTTIVQAVPGEPRWSMINGVRQFVTPTEQRTITTEVEGPTVTTSIIPQRTIFASAPCPRDGGPDNTPSPFPSPRPPPTTETSMSVSQFSGVMTMSSSSLAPSSVVQDHASSGGPSSSSASTGDRGQIITFSESRATGMPSSSGSSTSQNGSSTSLPNTTDPASSSRPLVIGAAIGGSVVAILLLVLLCWWCRKRGDRDDDDEDRWGNHTMDTKEDYWERRFQALESSGGGDEKREGDEDGVETAEAKKIRLTLDLHSKNLPTRPASRLSLLSAFFRPMGTPKLGAEPFKGSQEGRKLNFSRPIGPNRPRSSSTKHRSVGSSIHKWMSRGASGFPDTPVLSSSEREHRRGMDWSRTRVSTSVKSVDTLQLVENGRNSIFVTPPSADSPADALDGEQPPAKYPIPPPAAHFLPHVGSADGRSSAYSDTSAIASVPPLGSPTSDKTGSATKSSPRRSTYHQTASRAASAASLNKSSMSRSSSKRSSASASRRTLYPSTSSMPSTNASRRASRRLTPLPVPKTQAARGRPPHLQLSRDAITPSLWTDDDLLADFDTVGDVSVFSPPSTAPTDAYGGLDDSCASRVSIRSKRRTREPANAGSPTMTESSFGGADDGARGGLKRMERSAVTPQLPVLGGIGSPMMMEWELERAERLHLVDRS